MDSARRRLCLLAGLALLPGLASAQDYAAKGFELAATTPRETSPENLAEGKALYQEHCRESKGALSQV